MYINVLEIVSLIDHTFRQDPLIIVHPRFAESYICLCLGSTSKMAKKRRIITAKMRGSDGTKSGNVTN